MTRPVTSPSPARSRDRASHSSAHDHGFDDHAVHRARAHAREVRFSRSPPRLVRRTRRRACVVAVASDVEDALRAPCECPFPSVDAHRESRPFRDDFIRAIPIGARRPRARIRGVRLTRKTYRFMSHSQTSFEQRKTTTFGDARGRAGAIDRLRATTRRRDRAIELGGRRRVVIRR